MRRLLFITILLLLITSSFAQIDSKVYKELDKHNEVNVIVTYSTNITSTSHFSTQSDVLSNLKKKPKSKSKFSTQEDYDIDLKHKYNDINGFSGKITKSGLKKLKQLNVNVKIPDTFHATLDSSVPVIEGDKLHTLYPNLNGSGQTVCLIDTGIDYTHPNLGNCDNITFLSGNCSKVIGGYDFVNDDNNPMEDNHHGTHVAGIIMSNHSTYRGIAPGTKIVSIKALDNSGVGTESDIIAGIDWCVSNASKFNISVISMSIGTSSIYNSACDSDFTLMSSAINSAKAQNIAVVVASGNSYNGSIGISSPACIANAISVGRTNDNDTINPDSKTATILDVLAPGTDIISTYYPGHGFASLSGTSMSTPFVSGLISIMYQYNALLNRTQTVDEILSKLKYTSKQITDSRVLTGYPMNFSRVNALAASTLYLNYTIQTPTNNTLTSNTYLYVNTTSDVNISACLLEINNGTKTNYSMINKINYCEINQSLTKGNYTYKVYANDSINIFSSTTLRTYYIDSNSPEIFLHYPTNNSYTTLQFINYTVTDNLDTELNCSLYLDNQLNQTQLTINNSLFNTSLTNSNHTYYITCTDDNNNTQTSNIYNFTLDTIYPTITNLNTSLQTIYNNNNVTITFNITEQNLDKFWLRSNFTGTYQNYTLTQFNYTIKSTNLSNQELIGYQIFVNDSVGHLNYTTLQTFQVSNRKPTNFNLTSPENNTNSTIPSILFKWNSSSDLDGDNLTYYLQLSTYSNFSILQYNESTTELNKSLTIDSNFYFWKVQVCDLVTCINSSNIHTLNISVPMIYIYTPTNNSYQNSNFNLNITLTNNNITESYYNITNSTSLVQNNSNLSMSQPTYRWFDLVNLSDGNYNLTVYGKNNLNGSRILTHTFIIDKTNPTLTEINTPTNQSNSYVYIKVNCSDKNINTTKLNWNGTEESFTNNSGTLYWSNKSVSDGIYYFNSTCYDLATNTNTTDTHTLTIDTTAPSISTSYDSSITVGSDLTVTVTVTDLSSASVNFTYNNEEITADSISGNIYTYTINNPTLGSKTFTINATDYWNHSTETTKSFTVSETVSSSSTSSGGGSGGSGSATTTTSPTNQKTQTYVGLTPSIPAKMSFANKNIALESLEIKVKENLNMDVTVIELSKAPSVTLPNTYKYFKITTSANSSQIKEAIIEFKVNKSWIDANHYDESLIVLNRYTNNQWMKLPTTIKSRGDTYIFSAITAGFSYFAITGEEKVTTFSSNSEIKSDPVLKKVEPVVEEVAPIEDEVPSNVIDETITKTHSNYLTWQNLLILLGIVLLLTIIEITYLLTFKPEKKTSKKIKEIAIKAQLPIRLIFSINKDKYKLEKAELEKKTIDIKLPNHKLVKSKIKSKTLNIKVKGKTKKITKKIKKSKK